jgi:hypothetical protein
MFVSRSIFKGVFPPDIFCNPFPQALIPAIIPEVIELLVLKESWI